MIPVIHNGEQKLNGEVLYSLYTINVPGKQTTFSVCSNEDVQKKAKEALKRFSKRGK